MNMKKLQQGIGEWAVKTFPEATPESWVKHLRKEIEELAEDQSPEEAADCLILLLGWCYKVGVNAEDIIAEKMAINKKRKWMEPDGEGVVEHVREDSTDNDVVIKGEL